MRRVVLVLALSTLLSAVLPGCADRPAVVSFGVTPAPGATADAAEDFDADVRPQDDFYHYVNGHWLAAHPVPADKSNYGAFTVLRDNAQRQLRDIIEAAATDRSHAEGSDEQKVGDFYAAFMDKARVDALGLKPLEGELARIAGVRDRKALAASFAHLSRIGVDLIPAYIDTDARQSSRYMVYLFQGGTGLPDRDYYLEQSERFKGIRQKYVTHIGRMFELAGEAGDRAKAEAAAVMALETRLARAQWDKVASRDAEKTYNRYAFADLPSLMPGFDWTAFVAAMGISRSDGVVVAQPSFFEAYGRALQDTPLATIRAWMRWHLLRTYAADLSKPFVDEHFAFYGTTLNGIEQIKPRWKRGVDATQDALGEVLGRIYVAEHFPPAAKARMEQLVHNLLQAYAASIRELDWMSDATKARALEKLAKFTPKIGYPDKWKDYSALEVSPDDLIGNIMRSRAVEHDREVAKLGGPIDRDEWFMTPQTVNAYYNPGMNEIVFPAAILQPPFFDMQADDATNYGGIGAVIGHEIGHGFDDQGSKYDGDGNLDSWWTDQDRKRFEARTRALISQYDAYQPIPGQHVNGAFTIGENIGDLGGLSIAYKAYHMSLHGKAAPVVDGLSGDQRLFVGWARVWRNNAREANVLQRLKADPHSPPEFRCNGVVRNIPGWYAAFDVQPGDRLYLPPEQRVKIW